MHPILFAAAVVSSATAPAPLQASAPPPQVFKLQLGAFTVTAIGDGIFALPTDQLLVDPTPGEVASLLARADAPVVQPTSVNAFLVDTGRKRILIDSGGGGYFGSALGKFPQALKAAGYKPEDIDEVLITHVHADHVGGLAANGVRTFPNAVIRLAASEQAFWLDRSNTQKVDASVRATFDAVEESLRPYLAAGKVQAFAPGATLAPGITAVALPGHTIGHTGYRITSRGKTLLVWGDVMHVAAVQRVDPAITIRFDSDQAEARATRIAILGETARDHALVAGAHLTFPGIGRFSKAGSAWNWTPVVTPTAR
jgi:glyoxylase-like metal-dependent hydrolase (beta-lactamase superfamily II)